MNITNIGKYILEKLTNDERIINYSNSSRETDNYSVVSDYDFFKKFGTLYNLFFNLYTKAVSTEEAVREQNELIKILEELKNFILSKEESIKEKTTKGARKGVKTKAERKEDIKAQRGVLKMH